MTSAGNPGAQSRFQVRFGFGAETPVIEGAHVVVWVDALADPTAQVPTFAGPAAVVTGGPAARADIAAWVLDLQARRSDRATVAVVAAGGTGARFAVEDFVAAGAVIDALAELGIDYASPEAAAAAGAWVALRNAGSHVLSASVTGQELLAAGGSLDAARAAWSAAGIRVVREFEGQL